MYTKFYIVTFTHLVCCHIIHWICKRRSEKRKCGDRQTPMNALFDFFLVLNTAMDESRAVK